MQSNFGHRGKYSGDCPRITGNSEKMQMLQTAAFARVPARTRFAQESVPGHSLRYDLSAPPPASQVFATGVASARETMLQCRKRRRANLSPKLFHLTYRTFCFTFLSAPFSLGHERERRGMESQASVCFIGGNPVLLRAEPIKQKTRRPECRREGNRRAYRPGRRSLSFPCWKTSMTAPCLAITVAVGTTIADRPPHRSVQARLRIRLLSWMSGGKAGIRIRMQNAGLRNPPVQERGETIPAHLGALTATD